jgi:AsmA protein
MAACPQSPRPMNTVWIRRLLWSLLAVLVLLGIAAAVLIATFDANRYKGLAIDWMQKERQRTLTIDGPIELSVFPSVAVKLSGVKLSEHRRADEFASVQEAALSVRVMPLLSRQLVIDKVSARGVKAVYTRNAKGERNIDDLLASPASTGPSAGPAPHFDVSGVQFDDLALTVRDDLSKVQGTVILKALKSGRLADQVETPVSLQAAVDLKQPQVIKLQIDGSTMLKPNLAQSGVALSGMKLRAVGDVPQAKGLDATFGGALSWDGNALKADKLTVDVARAQLAGLSLAGSKLAAAHLALDPKGEKLELDKLQLSLAGTQGKSPFEATLDWPQLAVTATSLKGSGLSGKFKISGASSLSGEFKTGAPSGQFNALRLPALALTAVGAAGPRKVDANLKTDVVLSVGRTSASFERLDLKAAIVDPALKNLELAVRGSASADTQQAKWALDGSLNANRFDSTGSTVFGGKVPNVQATARFDNLDLNKLLASDKAAAAAAPTAAAPAETAIDMDGINAINGKFALTAGELSFRQYRVADAKLDVNLDGGNLRIPRLTGRAWGGNIEASGSASAKGALAVQLNASGVNVNALLKDVAGKDILEGTGRVQANITTGGNTLGALRSNMAGTAALQLRDGAVKGINLAKSFRQAKAALTGRQDAVSKAQQTEKTDFSELTATAQIANGVARSTDLDAKSPFLRLGGAGTFDIGKGRIDYTAKGTVVATTAGQDSELAALKGITIPVLLSGPFEAIDWKIQWSQVASAALEAKAKDKLKEALAEKLGIKAPAGAASGAASAPSAKEQVKDKLKEGLKGLFK